MTDPRVEAVADPLCRMLGRLQPLDRAPLMIADAIRGGARELLAAADAAAWQPIETAPKPPLSDSGPERYILGYCPPEHPHDRVRVIWWEPQMHGGMWQDDRDLDKAGGPKPTHWQPLPPPPSPAVPLDGEGEQDAAEPTEDEVERAARAMIAEMSLRLAMVVEISLHRDEGDPTDWADLSEDDRRAAMQVARAALIAARSRT